ncbi:MAG: class I SAM-dependent methyltransferase, partial [Syntrophothermus sp.]
MAEHDKNQEQFDSLADEYVDLALMPAERRALAMLAPRLAELEMLDLGIGTGRTGYTFAPLVRRYVGIDYSQRMIDRARKLLGEGPGVELIRADARDLSSVEGRFDFVLFSFNGIDAASPDDRLRIIAEVRRLLRPGGWFQFSSHSLGALPLSIHPRRDGRPRGSRLRQLETLLADLRYARRIRRINARIDLAGARERGWVIVPERGHFRIDDYYVDPGYQVRQLREAGFEVKAIIDPAGREVSLPVETDDP